MGSEGPIHRAQMAIPFEEGATIRLTTTPTPSSGLSFHHAGAGPGAAQAARCFGARGRAGLWFPGKKGKIAPENSVHCGARGPLGVSPSP